MIKYLSADLNLYNNIYITTIFGCKEEDVDKNLKEHLDTWIPKFYEEMSTINPQNIILLGHKVVSTLGLSYSSFDSLRGVKHTLKFDKYYPAFVTYSLEELYYLNTKIRGLVKKDLDFLKASI
jgi:uracil-DNA glycosylase